MNTVATIGDNSGQIDYAKEEVGRLKRDYADLERSAVELETEGEAAAEAGIADPESKGVVTSLIKRIRDMNKRAEGLRELEGMPHHRRKQGVDQFFFGIIDRLAKRDRKNNDGIGDRLQKILTDYDTRILAEEQERRRQAALETARLEREAREAREKAEREARELEEAAARARAPAKIEEKTQVAAVAAEEASSARVEETVASARAEEAHVAAQASPADIMRTRGADGTLSTMGTEKFCEITSRKELEKHLDKIAGYIPIAALETAAKAYANSHGYSSDESVQIPGVRFGKRPRSVVR